MMSSWLDQLAGPGKERSYYCQNFDPTANGLEHLWRISSKAGLR